MQSLKASLLRAAFDNISSVSSRGQQFGDQCTHPRTAFAGTEAYRNVLPNYPFGKIQNKTFVDDASMDHLFANKDEINFVQNMIPSFFPKNDSIILCKKRSLLDLTTIHASFWYNYIFSLK